MTRGLRVCSVCCVPKPLTAFARRADGFRRVCRECTSLQGKARRRGISVDELTPEQRAGATLITDAERAAAGSPARRAAYSLSRRTEAPSEKVCRTCKETLPGKDFCSAGGPYLASDCKRCTYVRNQAKRLGVAVEDLTPEQRTKPKRLTREETNERNRTRARNRSPEEKAHARAYACEYAARRNVRLREERLNDPEKLAAYRAGKRDEQRQYYERDPEKYREKQRQYRALKKQRQEAARETDAE